MSLSQAKRDSIEEIIQDFRKVLHSSLPHRNISQFYGDEKIREAADLEKEKVLKKFTEANPNLGVDLLREGLQNVIDEFVKKNEDHKSQSEAFFKKQVDLICETFMMSSKAKLEINPEMDLESVEEMLENGKMVAMKYFENNWKLGNVELYKKQEDVLKMKLDHHGKEMLENQRLYLESIEAEKVFEEVKAIILEMSRQVKCYVDTYEGKVSKQVLKEKAENIYDYLDGKGYVLNEKYESTWSKLIGTAKAAVTVLNYAEENMSPDDCIRFAERLDTRIKMLCSETEAKSLGTLAEQNENALQMSKEATENEVELTEEMVQDEPLEIQDESFDMDTCDEVDSDIKIDEKVDQSSCQKVDLMVKRSHPKDLEESNGICCSEEADHRIPKRQKLNETTDDSPGNDDDDDSTSDSNSIVSVCTQTSEEMSEERDLNVPDKGGDFPLLRAIREGKCVEFIRTMLDNGANVNIKTNDYIKRHAGIELILSILNEKRTTEEAMTVLDLLLANGFNLINEGDFFGYTATFKAMGIEKLNTNLLTKLKECGADFNVITLIKHASDKNRKVMTPSILSQAVSQGKDERIIRKLLDFGANPKYVDKDGINALHVAAQYANVSALKCLIDKVDVSGKDVLGQNPLHHLFWFGAENRDYGRCLILLLGKGVDFHERDVFGNIPLVSWMNCGSVDFVPTVMKMKDSLPITQDMASATLTAVVKGMGLFKKFLPSSSQEDLNEFAKFILFLIQEKQAKLRLKGIVPMYIATIETICASLCLNKKKEEITIVDIIARTIKFSQFNATIRDELGFPKSSRERAVPNNTEVWLAYPLISKDYGSFVRVCDLVEPFCETNANDSEDLGVPNQTFCLPSLKELRKKSHDDEKSVSSDLNVPDENGQFPLLLAIHEGPSIASIQKMLQDGANVNIRANDDHSNAAHLVIGSLMQNRQTVQGALSILDLLVSKGFRLINQENRDGVTPLLLAIFCENLNEELLNWFHRNGAEFPVDDLKKSPLFHAISEQRDFKIIREILNLSGNLNPGSQLKNKLIFFSALCANESALEGFIDEFDLNDTFIQKRSLLHVLFEMDYLDYQKCLQFLLKKEADFRIKDKQGNAPLVAWMKSGKGNFFTTLMSLKDELPITPEMASDTLTAIVEEIERLKICLPTRRASNEFVQFIWWLINEKRGRLRLKDEGKWKLPSMEDSEKAFFFFSHELCDELWTTGGLRWTGSLIHIDGPVPGNVDVHTKSEKVGTIPVEIFLLCLLRCRNYSCFLEVCQSLKTFCGSVSE